MSDYKKTKKNKEKRNNIVPFKKDLQVLNVDNSVDVKQAEVDRINSHAREVFKKLEEFADNCKISNSEVWYSILFFAKQRAIHSIPYANFKINDEGSTKEVTENFKEFYSENFPELFAENNNNRTLN